MKKRILFYIKDPNGGTGRFLETMLRVYGKNLYDIKILTNLRANSSFQLREKIFGHQQPKQDQFSYVSICRFIANVTAFRNEIKIFRPDYIFSLDLYANCIAVVTKVFFPSDAKNILSTHVNLYEHIFYKRSKLFSLFLLKLIRRLYSFADMHYVPSSELRLQLIHLLKLPKKRIVAIPYPVDGQRLLRLSKKKADTPKHFFLSMQRLSEQKKTSLLLESFRKFVGYHPHYHLVILGDGNEKEILKKKVKSWGLSKKILILGWKENPYPYIRKASAVILVTNFEGYPYSLLETHALGTRCIASDVDFGPREILDSKDVLLRKNSEINISNALDLVATAKVIKKKKRPTLSLHRSKYLSLLQLTSSKSRS